LSEREESMQSVRSKDGTTIAFDRLGVGTPVVLVSGASTARTIHAQLAQLLAVDFAVFNYDRRGRGDSGDTPPYTIEREVEDLDAVITEAGGAAAVFGNSSGGVLALRAAAASLPIARLALWEPPFMVDPDAPRRQAEYVAHLTELLDAGRRGDAMALFMKTIGLPEEMIAGIRQAPMWSGMEAIAYTLLYDATVMGDSTVPGLVASVKAPTLALDGSETGAWAANSAQALTGALPNPQHRTLQGQDHNVAWEVLAPVVREFFRVKASNEKVRHHKEKRRGENGSSSRRSRRRS
jgi:pimeloyl-ACP methyl ester carboxylesterase